MKVFFVRHGRSIGNENRIHQASISELSEKGNEQAESLSERFKKININLIITSPFKRARQTAEIINKNLNKPIEESNLFRELKRPTEIEGLDIQSTNALKIKKQILINYHNPSYKHSDEETFFEFRDRGKQAIKFLETKKDFENILVVTHGELIRCLFGLMLMKEKFDSHTLISFNKSLKSYNTGIMLCEFKEEWNIITWNDISHLG